MYEPPLQIKADERLAVASEPSAFAIAGEGDAARLEIDGRSAPIEAPPGAPLVEIGGAIARVPAPLRARLARLVVRDEANPSDAAWSAKYGATVLAGMSATAAGKITIYPHGLAAIARGGVFVRNLMHELGHVASLRDFASTPGSEARWVEAMRADRHAPSRYAELAYRRSGLPYQDAAEAIALYFLVCGGEAFELHRARMPARFEIVRAMHA